MKGMDRKLPALLLGTLVAVITFNAFMGDIQPLNQSRSRHSGSAVHTEPRTEASGNSSGPAIPGAASVSPHAAERHTAILPDSRMPLALQWPELQRLAEAGNPEATCRLTISVSQCREWVSGQRTSAQIVAGMANQNSGNHGLMIDLAAQQLERLSQDQGYCDGIDPATLPPTESLVQRFMHRLTPRQKTLLVLTRPDGSLRHLSASPGLGVAVSQRLPQFLADHSVTFLQEGFQAHDPLALEGLILLHAPASILASDVPTVWKPNPRLFMQYASLWVALHGEEQLGETLRNVMQIIAMSMSEVDTLAIQDWVADQSRQWRRTVSTGASGNQFAQFQSGKMSIDLCAPQP